MATISACGGGSKDPAGPAEAYLAAPGDAGTGRAILVGNANAPQWPRDPVTITSATITGDTLILDVSFSGGCAEHQLQLLVDTVWMESYPVQIGALLAHDDRDDPCDAIVTGAVRFDLRPLAQAYRRAYQSASGKIALRLAGAPHLIYEF
ncbi:MAG TPA: hypothetical protein VF178_12615 [Gemmatimonadaceae bacterium]